MSLQIWFSAAAVALAVVAGALVNGAYGARGSIGLAILFAGVTVGLLWFRRPPAAASSDPATLAAWDAVDDEVRRSRRHGRPFVMVSIPGDAGTATLVRPLLRAPDKVWAEEGNVYLLLTECDRDQALGFVARVSTRMPALFDPARVAFAAFPADAITVGGLLEALEPRVMPADAPATQPGVVPAAPPATQPREAA